MKSSNRIPIGGAGGRTDPDCPLALHSSHTCRDRDNQPLDGRGRACFKGARELIRQRTPDVVDRATGVIRAYEARVAGRIFSDAEIAFVFHVPAEPTAEAVDLPPCEQEEDR